MRGTPSYKLPSNPKAAVSGSSQHGGLKRSMALAQQNRSLSGALRSQSLTTPFKTGSVAHPAAQTNRGQRYNQWRQRRRWWKYGGAQGQSSQWAAGIQSCLAQLVGPWVPQDGIIGPQTRRAVQIFQGQQQMPVTGMLDATTVATLQSACSGQAPGPLAPPPDTAAPAPAALPPAPPTGAGPQAPAGPPNADAPEGPDAAGEAEVSTGDFETEMKDELRVNGQCKVEIESHSPIPLSQDEHFQRAPNAPAVYVIYIDGKPWHVGVAEHNLRYRLLSMSKLFKNLNLPASILKNRTVAWYSLRTGTAPQCAIQKSERGSTSSAPVHAKHGILRILKQFLSRKLGTQSKGNGKSGDVFFGPGGSLAIFENGKQIANIPAGSRI